MPQSSFVIVLVHVSPVGSRPIISWLWRQQIYNHQQLETSDWWATRDPFMPFHQSTHQQHKVKKRFLVVTCDHKYVFVFSGAAVTAVYPEKDKKKLNGASVVSRWNHSCLSVFLGSLHHLQTCFSIFLMIHIQILWWLFHILTQVKYIQQIIVSVRFYPWAFIGSKYHCTLGE